jgi:hypothetical protein
MSLTAVDPRTEIIGMWRLVEIGPGGEKHYPFGDGRSAIGSSRPRIKI